MRISLTTPNGYIFEIQPSKITALLTMDPKGDMWAPGTCTIVSYGDPTIQQAVKETIAIIKQMEEALEKKISLHRSPKSSH